MPTGYDGDLRIVGAEKLSRLGADLKAAGDKDLRRELMQACGRLGKAIAPEIPKAFEADLPHAGGFGSWAADGMKVKRRVRTIGKGAGVRFVVTRPKGDGEADVRSLDRGRYKHPTWGHKPWVIQLGRSGVLDRLSRGFVARRAREEFIRAVDAIAAKLAASSDRAA